MPVYQRTIKAPVVINGVGIHTGKKSFIVLKPARPHTGVLLRNKYGSIVADLFGIGDSSSNTTIERDGVKVSTVEHLMSCLYGLSISNVEVEVHGDEIPVGDGSAKHFYDAIMSVGIKEQKAPRIGLVITDTTTIKESSNRYISIFPSDKFIVQCTMNWHKNVKGSYTYVHEEDNYLEVVNARTFGERKYVEELQKKGLSRGTKFGENCIDIDNNSRVSQECVKHKILDIIGDLALYCGYYIIGKVKAVNSGHALHHKLIKDLIYGKGHGSNRKGSTHRRRSKD